MNCYHLVQVEAIILCWRKNFRHVAEFPANFKGCSASSSTMIRSMTEKHWLTYLEALWLIGAFELPEKHRLTYLKASWLIGAFELQSAVLFLFNFLGFTRIRAVL